MREGDIFSWRWADAERDNRANFGDYHCKSQIAVFDGHYLYDTFWGSRPTDNSYLRIEDVSLTLLGNRNELEVLTDNEAFYCPDDIIIMRHSNDSRAKTLVKPGASRCKEAMRKILETKILKAEQEIRSATSDMRYLAVLQHRLENGEINDLHF